MASGFRIQTVSIEGFKGFTTRKEIDFRGHHVFLLGENGNGKSSVIEAVRWGLFGSTGRPNEIVANRGYNGRCRVEIMLIREGKKWNLRRTLLRGVTGGNDPILTDELGQEHPLREIMPQLDSVDAGEGAHIIFAPQSTPLRRQPEDLSSFERSVFSHLGLAPPQSLLSQIGNFLKEQESIEKDLAEKLTDTRSRIDNQIGDLERQRGRVLASPPWEDPLAPSVAESESKARALIERIAGKPPDASLSGVSLAALIDHAEDALKDRHNQNQGGLEKELRDIEIRLVILNALQNTQESIETQQSEAKEVRSKRDSVLEGNSLDGFRSNVSKEKAAVDTVVLRLRIAEDSISLLHREETESVFCPICETEHGRYEFESKLQKITNQLSGDPALRLRQLEDQLKEAEDLEREDQRLEAKLTELSEQADEFRHHISGDGAVELVEPISTDNIKELVSSISARKSSIEMQIDNQRVWLNEKGSLLSKLKEEELFHKIQNSLFRLEQSKKRFERAKNVYEELVSFGESVRTIEQAVRTCLTERLEEEIPSVSEKLSKVFSALTRHRWYDQLTIAKDKLPNLELRVTSSHDPSSSDPTGVLNGQAESALGLVPYFTFSDAEDTPTEVYLVLLDDPTRAFDEGHIEILIECLAELGRNVQLIVASQETPRFRKLVPEKFEPSSYVIVEPTQWSYQDGPQLCVEYG